MRKSVYWTAGLVLVVILAPLMVLLGPWAGQKVSGDTVQDDELVLLESNGRIKVVDPHVVSGYYEVNWQSDSTGWTAVTLGDFNGDGDEEILATKGRWARLFDPVVQPGQEEVSGQWTISSPYKWYEMATGDIDADGRDEVVLLREDDAPGNIKSHVLVYDGDTTGRSWTLRKDLQHGTQWDDVDLGDVNADGRQDIGLIRSEDKLLLILNPVNWSELHNKNYDFTWLDLEMIEANQTIGADEIALSRKGVLGYFDSVLVFRWTGGANLADVWGGKFYPYFNDIEGADLSGDGDEEIIMYRKTDDPVLNLVARDPHGTLPRVFEPSGANNPGGGWLDLETGDLDADGKDEVILLRSTKYRVYDRPESSDYFYEEDGSFKGDFAVGNLDGDGIPAGPALGVNPNTLTFSFEGMNPPAQSVLISNVGVGDEFTWTATVTQGADWLNASPASGTTPATLSVSVDGTTLTSGTYQGQIRIDAEDGVSGSPQYVDVTLEVTVTMPRLGVTPDALTFEMDQGKTNPLPQSVEVQNLGGGAPLEWTATIDPASPWLSIVPTSETTPTTAWVQVEGSALETGTYVGYIVFDAGNVLGSPFTLMVTLTVHPPVMEVSPTSLQFVAPCSSPSSLYDSVAISQQGGGSDIQWMAIAVSPPAGGMAEFLNKAAGEVAEVTAQGLALGGEFLSSVDWVTLTPDHGTTHSIMEVQVDPDGLSVGWHQATIVIVGWPEEVSNRIQGVDVNLLVADQCVYVPLTMK